MHDNIRTGADAAARNFNTRAHDDRTQRRDPYVEPIEFSSALDGPFRYDRLRLPKPVTVADPIAAVRAVAAAHLSDPRRGDAHPGDPDLDPDVDPRAARLPVVRGPRPCGCCYEPIVIDQDGDRHAALILCAEHTSARGYEPNCTITVDLDG